MALSQHNWDDEVLRSSELASHSVAIKRNNSLVILRLPRSTVTKLSPDAHTTIRGCCVSRQGAPTIPAFHVISGDVITNIFFQKLEQEKESCVRGNFVALSLCL